MTLWRVTAKNSMDTWIGSEMDKQISPWELQKSAQTGFMLLQLSIELLVQLSYISGETHGTVGVERVSELISTLNIFPNIFLMSVNDPSLFPRISPQTIFNPTTVSKQEVCQAAPGGTNCHHIYHRLFHFSSFCDPDSCLGSVFTGQLGWSWACPSAEKPSGWVGPRGMALFSPPCLSLLWVTPCSCP